MMAGRENKRKRERGRKRRRRQRKVMDGGQERLGKVGFGEGGSGGPNAALTHTAAGGTGEV